MGDKANTKRGNMVALPSFGWPVEADVTAGNPSFKVGIAVGLSTAYTYSVTVPFAGYIVAMSYDGEGKTAGTYAVKLLKNDAELTTPVINVATVNGQTNQTWVADSAGAVSIAAGDVLSVRAETSQDFVGSAGNGSVVVIYVVFANT